MGRDFNKKLVSYIPKIGIYFNSLQKIFSKNNICLS